MGDTYKKSKGNTGIEGIKFQLNLLTVFLLNALSSRKNWKISTENEEAGVYDDIVLELPGESILLQAKHRKNSTNKLTKEQIFSNVKNGDFSLAKYFFSYHQIKTKFPNKTLIICTNTGIYDKDLKEVLIPTSTDDQSMLYYKRYNYLVYTLNEKHLPDLKENIETYYKNNLQSKGVSSEVITEDNMKDFLKNLQIYCNYPSGDKLDQVIDQLLTSLNGYSLYRKISVQDIYKKVEDWFRQPKGEYLNKDRAKAMFSEIKSDKYCETLKNYNVSFDNNINFPEDERIFHITSKERHLLPTLRVYYSLQNNQFKKLFVDPTEDVEVQKQVIEAFGLPRYIFLIVITTTGNAINTVYHKLKSLLEKMEYKKVIFVTDDVKELNQHWKYIFQVDGCVRFEELSQDTQKRLVTKKIIKFQGSNVSLEELIAGDYAKAIDSEILEKLVAQEEVVVGSPPSTLDKHTLHSYIERTFRKTKCQKDESGEIKEDVIDDVKEKVILIADSAGMGKTTILTRLAVLIKQKKPHLWIIRLDLNDFTRKLNNLLLNDKQVSISKLLSYKDTTRLKNQLERFVFSMKGKVVMMLDGVDEISPDYTGLILNLLTQCRQAANFAKIFVTTRPHMVLQLEEVLKVQSFFLYHFTEQNQVDFLTNHWTLNLRLRDKDKEKCQQYARMLIRNFSSCTKRYHYKENNFSAIPLQVRMLAEIFQENITEMDWEGCKEYVNGITLEPKLPAKMEIKKIYDLFVKKKRDAFVYKGTPNATSTANKALMFLFNQRLVDHRSLALELILSENKCNMFSSYVQVDENAKQDLLDIGIVHSLYDSLHFTHRNFAEYFFAEGLLKELQYQNQNTEFQRFFIEKVLWKPEFNLIRAFLNNFLKKSRLEALPSSIFRGYHSHKNYNDTFWWVYDHNPIFVLAEEGCVAILQLILKSINFKVVKDKEIDIKDIRKHLQGSSDVTKVIKSNLLNALEILVRHGGINIKDRGGRTPLHCATQEGHLEMVTFLVEQGARLDSRNYDGHTPLHLAVWDNHLDTVKALVEMEVDVNIRDNGGSTPLHFAVVRNHFKIVEFLLINSGNVNITDRYGRTALHLAAMGDQLPIAQLLVRNQVDVNINDKYGRKALHVAALSGQLDTVKFLVKVYRDVNIKDNEGNTALHLAVLRDHLNTVKHLLETGMDVTEINNDGNTALHLACVNGNKGILKLLVDHGVDVYIRGNYGRTALHLAASPGHLDAVKFLVELIEVNITDDNGNTALHVAALNGKLNTVKFLVDHHAIVNGEDKYGRTSLHLAAMSGKFETVKFLVGLQIDINVKDNDGNTALHLAALHGKLDTVKFIVKCGGDFNLTDRYCRTALHLAALGGKLNTVKYLVGIGIDVYVNDIYGRTAQDLAECAGKVDYPVLRRAKTSHIDHKANAPTSIHRNSGHFYPTSYYFIS